MKKNNYITIYKAYNEACNVFFTTRKAAEEFMHKNSTSANMFNIVEIQVFDGKPIKEIGVIQDE